MDLYQAVREFSMITGVTRGANSAILQDAQDMIWAEYKDGVENARRDGVRVTWKVREETMTVAAKRVAEWFLMGEGGEVARLAIDAHYVAAHRRQHVWAVLAGHEWRRSNEQAGRETVEKAQ